MSTQRHTRGHVADNVGDCLLNNMWYILKNCRQFTTQVSRSWSFTYLVTSILTLVAGPFRCPIRGVWTVIFFYPFKVLTPHALSVPPCRYEIPPTCGRKTVLFEDGPLKPGECMESDGGSRWFGWMAGMGWKSRLHVSEDGGTYMGPNGTKVRS